MESTEEPFPAAHLLFCRILHFFFYWVTLALDDLPSESHLIPISVLHASFFSWVSLRAWVI